MKTLPLHTDTGIDGNNVLFVGQKRVDVHLLDLGGKAEEGGEADDDLGVALLIDASLSSRTLYNLICAQ